MAKDQTEVGITGKPIPKPRTAKQQYELEKKRRMQKHLGTNVGGTQYTSGAKYYVPSTSGTNPRARTFEEFIAIAEAIVYGGEKKEPEDTRMTVTAADKKANTKAWQNYQAGHSGYKAAAHLNKEETEVADKPATPEEKRRIRMMQQLERLKREKSASRMQSDVAREEYEIDEAKVEAGMTPDQKRRIRTGRSDFTDRTPAFQGGHSVADYERRGAHRERDELNKDAKSIRKGKLDQPQFQGKTGQERIAAVKKAKGMK